MAESGKPVSVGKIVAIVGGILGLLLVAAVVVALLVIAPAVRRAGETRTAKAMHDLSRALAMYNAEYERYPPHLAATLIYRVPPQTFRDPRFGRPPAAIAMKPETDWKSFTADIDAHCDYVYLAGGFRPTAPTSMPILYAKERTAAGTWITVFNDFHVANVTSAELAAGIEEINKERISRRETPFLLPPM